MPGRVFFVCSGGDRLLYLRDTLGGGGLGCGSASQDHRDYYALMAVGAALNSEQTLIICPFHRLQMLTSPGYTLLKEDGPCENMRISPFKQASVGYAYDIPIWLNADILSGPGARNQSGVDADFFLSSCAKKFPIATISIGWTTGFGGPDDRYTPADVEKMTEALSKNCVLQPVTFAVRAALAAKSHDTLVNLIQSSSDATTLTIWSSVATDVTDMEALKKLVHDVGTDRAYLDLPEDMTESFRSESSSSSSSNNVLLIGALAGGALVVALIAAYCVKRNCC